MPLELFFLPISNVSSVGRFCPRKPQPGVTFHWKAGYELPLFCSNRDDGVIGPLVGFHWRSACDTEVFFCSWTVSLFAHPSIWTYDTCLQAALLRLEERLFWVWVKLLSSSLWMASSRLDAVKRPCEVWSGNQQVSSLQSLTSETRLLEPAALAEIILWRR